MTGRSVQSITKVRDPSQHFAVFFPHPRSDKGIFLASKSGCARMIPWEGMTLNETATYLQHLNKRPELKLQPSLLWLAPFLASMPLYVPNARIMGDLIGGMASLFPLVVAMAATCLTLSAVLMLLAAHRPQWNGFGLPASLTAALFYSISVGALVFLLPRSFSLPALFSCLGIIAGLGCMPVAMSWIRLYAGSVQHVMMHGALACIGSSLIGVLLSMVPNYLAGPLFLFCACSGAFAPIIILRTRKATSENDSRHDGEGECTPASNPPEIPLSSQIKNLLSVIWLPLLGFLLYLFVSASSAFTLNGTTMRTELIGGIGASVIALGICLVKTNRPFVLLVEKVIVPVLVAISIALGGFPAGSSFFLVGGSYVFVPLMFLSLFALSSLVAIADAGEFSLPFVFGAAFFASNLLTLIGVIPGGEVTTSDEAGPMVWVLICCYFAVFIIQLGYSSWRQLCHPQDVSVGNQARAASEAEESQRIARIEALADARSLTNREREILMYLTLGHGSRYIAKTLFISDNTARTHIRNIYKKLKVSSREELIALRNQNATEISIQDFPPDHE